MDGIPDGTCVRCGRDVWPGGYTGTYTRQEDASGKTRLDARFICLECSPLQEQSAAAVARDVFIERIDDLLARMASSEPVPDWDEDDQREARALLLEIRASECARQLELSPSTETDFGEALMRLRKGAWVARTGWNGRGMWLRLVTERPPERMSAHPRRAYIEMKDASGYLVPWLASQTDMLAEDWVEVERDGG